MRVGKKIIFSLISIIVALIAIFSVNSGKLLLVPYTKDFGIITRF